MIELKLHFTERMITDYLVDKGYKVVNHRYTRNTFSFEPAQYGLVTCAYKPGEDIPMENLTYSRYSQYRADLRFKHEIQYALLKL